MTRTVWLLVATLALVLTACGGSSSGTHDIKGTAWTVSTIGGQNDRARCAADHRVRQRRDDQRLDRLQHLLGHLHGRRRQADGLPAGHDQEGLRGPAVNAQEAAVTAALTGATSWSIGSDGNLTIKGADRDRGQAEAPPPPDRAVPDRPADAGRRWRLGCASPTSASGTPRRVRPGGWPRPTRRSGRLA